MNKNDEQELPQGSSRARMQRMRLFGPVWEAADAGKEQEAVELLLAYIRLRKEEAA
jgi:hypothetical protein